jgi:predicted AlkP superfamily pyrophosphatase or phosphodiesterase
MQLQLEKRRGRRSVIPGNTFEEHSPMPDGPRSFSFEKWRFACAAALAACFFVPPASAAPVLMISIDGLKPEYVTQASAHGLKIPYLRTLMDRGTYADGVTGVWPTDTYPSHTTLLTGVTPAEHGIYNNTEFEPELHFDNDWNWYAAQIQAPTLWRVAHNAGLHTASVGWPVSVGTRDVDWLIPEYWRGEDPGTGVNPLDRDLIAALSRPRSMMAGLEAAAGPYMMGNEATVAGDEIKTRYSLEILKKYKPSFMTIHLSALDEAEHEHGPFSPEADRTLEAIDGMVARLAQQALANDRSTVLLVVSDHGFMKINYWVNLSIPFVQAGLITVSVSGGRAVINAWKAQLWLAGGMVAVVLHDPKDQQAAQQVRTLLNQMATDPANGIAQILDRSAMDKLGCFPNAAFLIVLKPGYYNGAGLGGPMVTAVPGTRGSHGFSPQYPEMRASFFALGAGIAHHRDLGVIDMRQIAPTAARILGVPMPSAHAAPLHLQP